MSFLSDRNKEINEPAELDIFSVPANLVAVDKIYYTYCHSISSISTDHAPVEISIPSLGPEYMDLRRTKLHVSAKIVKANGAALTAGEEIGIINLPLQSIWSQIDVYANGKLISLNTTNYPWKSYLKCLFSYDQATCKSQLQSQLYYPDGGLDMDEADPKNGTNMSEEAQPAYKFILNDVFIKACKVRVDPGVIIAHSKEIEIRPAQYYFTRSEVKMQTIAMHSKEFLYDQIFANAVPTKLIVGFVSQSAVNGSYDKNPFNFHNFSITDVGVFINGRSFPGRPLKLDFSDNKNYASAFVNIFEGAEIWNRDKGLVINRELFENGYSLFVFTLGPTNLDEDYINLVRRGNVRLEIKFHSALPYPVNCIVYGEFPSLLEIDNTRDVQYIPT